MAQGFDVDEILNTYNKVLATVGEDKTPTTTGLKLARKTTLRRTESTKQKQQSKQNLVEDAEVNYGPVTWTDVRKFLSHSAGVCGFTSYMLISILVALLQLTCPYVLAFWAKQDFEEQ